MHGFYALENRLNPRSAISLNITASAIRKERYLKHHPESRNNSTANHVSMSARSQGVSNQGCPLVRE